MSPPCLRRAGTRGIIIIVKNTICEGAMLKILHTGDIHLDSPFSGLDARRSEIRRAELRHTFSSLMTYVRDNSIDLLLIAGDFFDTGFVTKETVSIVLREFSRVPDCKIVISPGNHDPYTPDSVYAKVKFPENVYIFKSSEETSFSFPELGCEVYGYAFTGETMRKSPLRPAEKSELFKILCAHAHLNSPLSPYCPISTAELEVCGFNYAALGHVHNAPDAGVAGGCVYAYCGCLEGRGYDETGPKGAIYAEVSDDGKIKLQRLIFSSRKYEVRRLNVTGVASCAEITEKIKALIRDENMDDTTLLRVILEGAVPPTLVISPEVISRSIGEVFALDIKDVTSPVYGGEYLESDPTIRGEFYRRLLPMLTSADERERAVASLALRIGLAAMAGENISISTAN